MLAVGVAIAFVAAALLGWPWGPIVAALVGGAAMHTRWVIWRRRHPVISARDYLDDKRRAAPWN